MKNLYTSVLLLLIAVTSKAQFSPAYSQMRERETQSQMNFDETPLTEGINGLDYDLVYARLDVRLNPDTSIGTPAGKYIWGSVTTYFKTGKTNFNRIDFDMAAALTCDSVYYHGVKLAAGNISEVVDTLRITLPNIAAIGTLDSVKVFYKGVPPQVPTWTTTGFVKGNKDSDPTPSYRSNGNYIHT